MLFRKSGYNVIYAHSDLTIDFFLCILYVGKHTNIMHGKFYSMNEKLHFCETMSIGGEMFSINQSIKGFQEKL